MKIEKGNRDQTTKGRPSGFGMQSSLAEERIRREYRPLGEEINVLSSAETLLRAPGRILFEPRSGNNRAVALSLLGAAVICFSAYGLTVAMFSWGTQLWAAPLKVTLGALISALICYPSLVVFTFLSGCEATLREVFSLLVANLSLSSLLLLGLGPIAWIFAQSTDSVAFMGAPHRLLWLIGLCCGMRFLGTAAGFLRGDIRRQIAIWGALFLLVSLQMTTTLRPIIGHSERIFQKEKKFFLSYRA